MSSRLCAGARRLGSPSCDRHDEMRARGASTSTRFRRREDGSRVHASSSDGPSEQQLVGGAPRRRGVPPEARLGRRRAAANCDRARRVPAESGGTPPSADGAAIDPLELERPPRAPVAVGRRRQLHRPAKGQHRRDDEEAAAWLQLAAAARSMRSGPSTRSSTLSSATTSNGRAGGLLELGDAAIAPPPAQLAPADLSPRARRRGQPERGPTRRRARSCSAAGAPTSSSHWACGAAARGESELRLARSWTPAPTSITPACRAARPTPSRWRNSRPSSP